MSFANDKPSALAVVIGRAGSKGLPGKNAKLLVNRSMVCHTIEDALNAGCVNRVIVSTDGEDIALAAQGMGVKVIRRPADLASDTATVDAAVRHAVENAPGPEQIIVILYANVPLRPDDLIDRAIQSLIETQADSVQSYSEVGKHHPYWMVTLDEQHRVKPHVVNTVYRRQDLPRLYLPDGGVIAVCRPWLFTVIDGQPHAFLGKDRRGIISPPGSVIDVDTAADFAQAETLINLQRSIPAKPTDCNPWASASAHHPYIIAEIGVNHDGSVARAIELVKAAKACGADAVKLQLFEADRLLSGAALLAQYQQQAGARDPHQMLRSLELSLDDMREIVEIAHDTNLHAIVTVFSVDLIAQAQQLPWDAFKTASPDIINRPLIEGLMRTGKPLLISTGAATLNEVRQVTRWLGGHPHALLHCVSAYPTPDDCAALAGRIAMREITPYAIGYSDHTSSLDTGALAVASGASVLEKHLTYDRNATGPDHAASLDSQGFAEYVRLAHRAFRMLGEPRKHVLDIEQDVRNVSRQSLIAARHLDANHALSAKDIAIKRPGGGLSPAELTNVIGRRLAKPIEADMPLTPEHLI